MSDVTSSLSEQEMADLSALADGTLAEERRAAVEARVAASPELRTLLERQRQAVLAARAVATEDVPPALRRTIEARLPAGRRGRRWRLAPRLAAATATAAAAAVAAAVLLSRGPGAPTVADTAGLAARPPTGPAPAAAGARLAVGVGGVAFPNLSGVYGWRAAGVRRDRVGSRSATVVFYRKDGRRLAYVIVGGSALSRPGSGEPTVIRGVEYQTLRVNDQLAVTWRRAGHTCVLVGQALRAELLRLASWPLTPPR